MTIGATTTTTAWAYNVINQIQTQTIGANAPTTFTYDANGRLTNDGVLTYTWNRADRLTTVNNGTYNTNYAYDGDHKRRSQTVGGTVTAYLLDTTPGLATVLAETTSGTTTYALHGPMGVLALQEGTAWRDELANGLGSVRSQVDRLGAIQAVQQYDPYGQPFGKAGTWIGTFGYAGEQIDSTGLSYNRARYYNPALGAFASLDPYEGIEDEPMSMNGYGYAHGNPVNWTDPSGEFPFLLLAVGAGIGAAIGAAIGVRLWDLANAGECGCEGRDWARNTDKGQWVLQQSLVAGIAALVGTGAAILSGGLSLVASVAASTGGL